MQRHGMTIPFDGVPLHAQRDWIVELADLGYTDVWSSEANGADAFTPLALASTWAPSLRLGTAIVPAFTRGPGLIAQSVGTLAQAAPGRFVLGVGTSSNVIVEGWNGIPFDEPYKRTRDVVRFLRRALAGEKVSGEFDTFSVRGFKLGMMPEQPVPILVAALREGMLRLAGREGDGAIINWLSADDVATVAPIVQQAGDGTPREVVARIFVAPTDDADTVRGMGRFAIAAYLNVPVYAAFHEWLGRGDRRVGPAREVPRARAAVCRQRGHDAGPGAPAVRPRPAAGRARPRPALTRRRRGWGQPHPVDASLRHVGCKRRSVASAPWRRAC
jgi:probable F420-dependent oxidoreductase